MAYQIIRVQKLKNLVSVRRSLKHAFRTQDTPNADPSKFSQNQNFGAKSEKQAMTKVKALMPSKLRKNGVVCVEHLVTASPEFFQGKSVKEQNAYFNDSLAWLRQKWGKENVVCGGVHRDEKTPHMYVYIVPKDHDTGRLNCRKWLGERDALSNMQSQFHSEVSKKYGLERGVKGSKAKHQTLKKYYEKLNDVVILEHHKPTTSELAAQLVGKDTRINKLIEQAALVPVIVNENKMLKRKHEEEQLRLLSINELSRKRNVELKNQFKDPMKIHQKALDYALIAKQSIESVDSLKNDNKALKIALSDSDDKLQNAEKKIEELTPRSAEKSTELKL